MMVTKRLRYKVETLTVINLEHQKKTEVEDFLSLKEMEIFSRGTFMVYM
jgi:hypothetical protein